MSPRDLMRVSEQLEAIARRVRAEADAVYATGMRYEADGGHQWARSLEATAEEYRSRAQRLLKAA